MAEPRTKYILLNDRVGENLEKNLLTLGLSTKSSPTQVLRGELLEALPEDEQPEDSRQIALVGLERKSLRLSCRTEDLTRLSDEEANLLLPISSTGERYNMFVDRKRLEIGRKIQPGSRVYVKVKGVSKDILGVVWYKGELPSTVGTMFGVELLENQGQGTTDGTFRNKKYFKCPEDSGMFISLDKITNVKECSNRSPRSPKKQSATSNIATKIKETVLQPFMKEKDERFTLIPGANMAGLLDIDQRVVAYKEDKPVRGYVRYLGEALDRMGRPFTIVGLELESRVGSGTGMYDGKQRFVCKKDFATFLPVEAVIPEKDFDNSSGQLKNIRESRLSTAYKYDDEAATKSMNYSVNMSAPVRGHKSLKRSNSMDSAAVIKAAGEPSKTDTTEFIEKQRQILSECNYSRLQNNKEASQSSRNNLEREDCGATEMEFDDNHYMSTSSDILNPGRDNRQEQPITKQPGLSSFYLGTEESERDEHYTDYVHIDKHDYKASLDPHTRGTNQVLARGLSQNSAIPGLSYPKSSQNIDEVAAADSGMDKRNTPVIANDVVADCRNEMELDHPQVPKEPYEHLDMASPPLKAEAGDISKTDVNNSHSLSVGVPQDMEVGSMVEVPMAAGTPRYGVIRWIGYLPQMKDKLVAGLELEDEQPACSDGTFYGVRYFTCPSGRGFFTLLVHCRQDSRFTSDSLIRERSLQSEKVAFGSIDSPIVQGITAPPSSLEDRYCGRMHGLQGHHNSCYLDATLYSMFAFTFVFDSLLHRERGPNDLNEYDEVQTVLREHIVNPLRKNGFVRADRLLHLRTLLDKLSSTSGLMNEEKDPEEFLNSLLQQVLKADPYLRLKSRDTQTGCNQAGNNEGAYLYQIITEKDETTKMVEVYQLLEQSFLSADLILSEVPSCLILQMPRFGSRYKMYEMILPNLELDITHLVENVPRECDMCGTAVAQHECKACYESRVVGDRKGVSSYCTECNEKVHKHRDRSTHSVRPLVVPRAFGLHNKDNLRIEKQTMELFAVVCIETSHYVAFVKCGTGSQAPWCFFDSMADRKGERNGYNIPAVTPCPEALEWLSKKPQEILAARDKGEIPEKARRLLGDSYLCMYQNLDMTMYK